MLENLKYYSLYDTVDGWKFIISYEEDGIKYSRTYDNRADAAYEWRTLKECTENFEEVENDL